jgi:glucose-6-phosphate isomerase
MTEPRIDYSLGEYENAVNGALEKMRRDNVIERIRAMDYTLWKSRPDEIINRLGWLDAPAETLAKINNIRTIVDSLQKDKISDIVLIGMGGSSLAAEVFGNVFGSKPDYPRLHIADTTDPVFISEVTQHLNLEKTLFLVSSKSGSTLEITSLFKYFYNLCLKNSGRDAGRQFIFITDEGSPLIKTAESISARYIFLNNPDIGGRYSALSLPGIVPAALIGVDVQTLLQNVSSNLETLMSAGVSLGATLGVLVAKGRDKLTLILPPRCKSFGDWLEQLIAESTGKEGKGILPVLDEPVRDQNTYGSDRVFVIFQNKNETKSTSIKTLVKYGYPVIAMEVQEDDDLGTQMFIWEMATAIAAHFMGVNPFDQPNVEATKKHTRAVIANLDKRSELADEQPALTFDQGEIFSSIQGTTPAETLRNFLKQAKAGDYICLQIFLSPAPGTDKAVQFLREVLARKYALPVTYGYGPRYLHSTGQLHKGDSGNGLFIQLTQEHALDVNIPDNIGDEKSSLTFGALKAAQAKGDRQALTEAGRRIIRIHFQKDPAAGLKNLAELL